MRITKCADTVTVKLLIETKVVEERERIQQIKNNDNHRLTIKGSALIVGNIIVRFVSSLPPTEMSWNVPKKRRRVDNVSISDI